MTDVAFRATTRRAHDVPVIDIAGELNGAAEAELNAAFADATRDNPGAVLLNFEQLTYMNSTGIALVVKLLAEARKRRLELLVCGLSEHYQHIFSITRLADFMSILDDEASALVRAAAPTEAE